MFAVDSVVGYVLHACVVGSWWGEIAIVGMSVYLQNVQVSCSGDFGMSDICSTRVFIRLKIFLAGSVVIFTRMSEYGMVSELRPKAQLLRQTSLGHEFVRVGCWRYAV